MFQTAIERIQSRQVTTSSRLEVLYNLSQQAQRLAEDKLKEEMDLSDAPEDFRGKIPSNFLIGNHFLFAIRSINVHSDD